MSVITHFTIFGERCSGTNYLEKLVKTNFGLTLTWEYGFKHCTPFCSEDSFEPGPSKNIKKCTNHILFLMIARNPYDWMRSLYRTPFHFANEVKQLPFVQFIQTDKHTVWNEELDVYPSDHKYNQTHLLTGINPDTALPFENLCDLRNCKNKSYLNVKICVNNFEYINYDELSVNPEKYMNLLAETFNLKYVKSFTNIESYRGVVGVDSIPYKPKKYVTVNSTALTFINTNLEWPMEYRLGFKQLN